ncbi:ras-related protein Rab-30-like [Xenia sp. Carnegie-2017]|uniref:ras-related protein Rab-30-like n=1 Tax=Xenia sp. Carnegie-2017 TaxID=2897299 RepID=UPI001F0331B0|nr:ras-related protein Rab-30-like [Xenia sp. Carnegie-2017]
MDYPKAQCRWEDAPRYSFKVVVLGSEGVGKTSLLKRLKFDKFEGDASNTIGVDFLTHTINTGKDMVQLTLWDTAGEERFKSLTSQFYRKADAAIIVFDLTFARSFNEAKDYWIDAFRKVVGSSAYIALIGNKSDLETKRGEFADLKGIYALETSAKDGTNVQHLFKEMAMILIENVNQLQSLDSGPDSLFMHNVPDNSSTNYYNCCNYQ